MVSFPNENLKSTAIGSNSTSLEETTNPETVAPILSLGEDVRNLDEVYAFSSQDIEDLTEILENFPSSRLNLSELYAPIKNPIEYLNLLEKIFQLVFSEQYYRTSQVPKGKLDKLVKNIEDSYNYLKNRFNVKTEKVYDNMVFAIQQVDLEDRDLVDLILVPNTISHIQQKTGNDMLEVLRIIAAEEERQKGSNSSS